MGYENTFGRKPRHNPQKRDKYITVAFHIAPKQHEELYNRIRLSGRRVQDYMTQSGLHQKIIVVGNESLRRRIIESLKEIIPYLKKIEQYENLDPVVMAELRTIFEITETWE